LAERTEGELNGVASGYFPFAKQGLADHEYVILQDARSDDLNRCFFDGHRGSPSGQQLDVLKVTGNVNGL
jgi:hypothetical protein